jgi:hypothetical protein
MNEEQGFPPLRDNINETSSYEAMRKNSSYEEQFNPITTSATSDRNSEALSLLQDIRNNPSQIITKPTRFPRNMQSNNNNNNFGSSNFSSSNFGSGSTLTLPVYSNAPARRAIPSSSSSSSPSQPPRPISFLPGTDASSLSLSPVDSQPSPSPQPCNQYPPQLSMPPPLPAPPHVTTTHPTNNYVPQNPNTNLPPSSPPSIAEQFANKVGSRLQTLGDDNSKRRVWIAWAAACALILAIGLAIFVVLLHSSHKDLSARVDAHAKFINQSLSTVVLSTLIPASTIATPSLTYLPQVPEERPKQQLPSSPQRFPREDPQDRNIAGGSSMVGQERWNKKTFEIRPDSSSLIIIIDWKDIPFDDIVTYGLCCRLHLLERNETLVCALESSLLEARLEREGGSGIGTRIYLRILETVALRSTCNFRYLITQ